MKKRTEYTCPLELTHDLIRGKWKPIILWQLGKGSCTLSALMREIRGISQKMLIQHIGELTDCGAVEKTNYEGYPLRTEYHLTERGEQILEAVSIMQRIGIEIMLEDDREDVLREKGLL